MSPIPCESCDSPATCTVRLSGPAGVDSFPACLACATDALMSARCSVRVVPFLAVAR